MLKSQNVFSCEEAALEGQMSVCVCVCVQVEIDLSSFKNQPFNFYHDLLCNVPSMYIPEHKPVLTVQMYTKPV